MRALLDRDLAVSCGPKERRGLSNLFFGFIPQSIRGKLESSSIMFAHGQFSFIFPDGKRGKNVSVCTDRAHAMGMSSPSLPPSLSLRKGGQERGKSGQSCKNVTLREVAVSGIGRGDRDTRGIWDIGSSTTTVARLLRNM